MTEIAQAIEQGCFGEFSFSHAGTTHTVLVFVEGSTGGALGGPALLSRLQNRAGHCGVVVVPLRDLIAFVDEVEIDTNE